MDLNLSGKTFIVTGASRGLGYATAAELVQDGANVVISGRNGDTISTAATQLGGNTIGVEADNASPGTASRLVDATIDQFGQIDGVLISVGGPPAGSMLDMTDEQWRGAR